MSQLSLYAAEVYPRLGKVVDELDPEEFVPLEEVRQSVFSSELEQEGEFLDEVFDENGWLYALVAAESREHALQILQEKYPDGLFSIEAEIPLPIVPGFFIAL
ncbi:MAG: hypothetical protein AB1330_01700 [Bacillota bacterium]